MENILLLLGGFFAGFTFAYTCELLWPSKYGKKGGLKCGRD